MKRLRRSPSMPSADKYAEDLIAPPAVSNGRGEGRKTASPGDAENARHASPRPSYRMSEEAGRNGTDDPQVDFE